MHHTCAVSNRSQRGRHLAALLYLLTTAAVVGRPAVPSSQSSAFADQSPPPKIDLNVFDALKRTKNLPNGESLAYIEMGNLSGPPVVMIHGYTDSARDWVPMLPYVSKRFHLILVDIRGHGQSSKPECCYSRLDFAYDIKLLLDDLHVQKTDLVSHS